MHYCTEAESKIHQGNAELLKNIGTVDKFLLSAYDFASRNITKLTDKYLPKHEYYNYKEPDKQRESVTQVIDKVYAQNQNTTFAEDVVVEKLVANGGEVVSRSIDGNSVNARSNVNTDFNTNISLHEHKASSHINPQAGNSGFKQSAKARFYANADYTLGNNHKDVAEKDLKLKWDRQTEILRKEASFKTEQIARDLLGEPNKRLSNARELRFGEGGKIAVRISGEKSGTWYDFSKGVGGDVFALVKEQQGCDFKGAAEYLRQSLSLGVEIGSNSSSLRLVHDFENSNTTTKYIKEQQSQERADKAKQVAAVKLYESSKAIEDNTTAHRYLTNIRGISCTLGQDIKAASIYDKEKALYLPALVAFARDDKGNITGGVQILLDSKTGNKASIDVPKKSFGKIAGSFVDVGSTVLASATLTQENLGDNSSNDSKSTYSSNIDKPSKHRITIIAEGLETALSIKQALSNDHNNADKEFKVLCSLGVNNIKNYKPEVGERVIIAADNDGHNCITDKTIKNAKDVLAGKGAFVEVARPGIKGDFNDLLMNKSQGKAKEDGDKREKEIAYAFSRALRRHTAFTLGQY